MQQMWFKALDSSALEDRFQAKWLACGGPFDAALVGVREGTTTYAYFTPEASRMAPDLLREFSADPCSAPDLHSRPGGVPKVSLLVGDQGKFEELIGISPGR
jgi:hypothetical protein